MNWTWIEWLDLALRWFHVMAGISWIGSSLYIMWLDRVFADPDRAARGENGEPWLIDLTDSLLAGKLAPGPGRFAGTLAWFARESTLTLASGLVLFAVLAWLPGGSILGYADGRPIGALPGVAIVAGTLALSWLGYDHLWRSPGRRIAAVAGPASLLLFVAAAWGLTQIFSGRAAFILAGAALGFVMWANLWLRIRPALKELREARIAGRPPDVDLRSKARMRAAHNSYLVFPTVALMLSNHFPHVYSHELNWIAMSLVAVALVGVRHRIVSGRSGAWALYSAMAAFGVAVFLVRG